LSRLGASFVKILVAADASLQYILALDVTAYNAPPLLCQLLTLCALSGFLGFLFGYACFTFQACLFACCSRRLIPAMPMRS